MTTLTSGKKDILPIIIFVVLVFVLAITGSVFPGTPEHPGLGFFLWALSPALSCLTVRILKKDWRESGINPLFKSKWRWYIVSFVAFPVILIVSVVAGKVAGIIAVHNFILIDFIQTVIPAFIVFFVFAIFEEFGWRGYLSAKLAALGMRSVFIYILVGLIWVSWHLPFMSQLTFLYVKEDLSTFIPRYFINGIVLAFVYHELRMHSDSFWPAVIFHATGNAMGHMLAAKYVTLKTGTDPIGAIGTGYISIILYFSLGLGLYYQRKKSAV